MMIKWGFWGFNEAKINIHCGGAFRSLLCTGGGGTA